MKIVSLILAATMPFMTLPAYAVNDGTLSVSPETQIKMKIAAEKVEAVVEVMLETALINAIKADQIKSFVNGYVSDATIAKAGTLTLTAGTSFYAAYRVNKILQAAKRGMIGRVNGPEVYQNWLAAHKGNIDRLVAAKKQLELEETLHNPNGIKNAEEAIRIAEENLGKALSTEVPVIPVVAAASPAPANPGEAPSMGEVTARLDAVNAQVEAASLQANRVEAAKKGISVAQEALQTEKDAVTRLQEALELVARDQATIDHEMKAPSRLGPFLLRNSLRLGGVAGFVVVYAAATGVTIQFNFDKATVLQSLNKLIERRDQQLNALSIASN